MKERNILKIKTVLLHIRIYTLFESILLSGTRVRGTYVEQQCGNFYFVFVIIKKKYIFRLYN